MDTVDKKTRSKIMASVGQRNTGPELLLRKALHHLGFRYRLHGKMLPGSPDLVFNKYRAVIFIHGCFWHRHGCRFSTFPSTRKNFWRTKFEANKKRDKINNEKLLQLGWRVLIVWQCAIYNTLPDLIAKSAAKWLNSNKRYSELPYIIG
ncbi:MAG: very short patch repair endonuclease [Sedimentisphaerales bacterium]